MQKQAPQECWVRWGDQLTSEGEQPPGRPMRVRKCTWNMMRRQEVRVAAKVFRKRGTHTSAPPRVSSSGWA